MPPHVSPPPSAPSQPLPLGDHLEDLRRVVFRGLVAIVLAFIVCFAFLYEPLLELCLAPLRFESPFLGHAVRIPGALKTLSAFDRLRIVMTVSLVAGTIFSAPYLAYLIWSFIASGLYPHERRVVHVFWPFACLLFILGSAFGYFILLPLAIDFLLNFGGASLGGSVPVQSDLLLGDYLGFFVLTTVSVGLAFEIPLFVMGLVRFTDITPAQIRRYRRHVIVATLVLGMLIMPPDIFSMLICALPLWGLFEFGLLLAERSYRIREQRRAELMTGADPWDELLGPTDPPKLHEVKQRRAAMQLALNKAAQTAVSATARAMPALFRADVVPEPAVKRPPSASSTPSSGASGASGPSTPKLVPAEQTVPREPVQAPKVDSPPPPPPVTPIASSDSPPPPVTPFVPETPPPVDVDAILRGEQPLFTRALPEAEPPTPASSDSLHSQPQPQPPPEPPTSVAPAAPKSPRLPLSEELVAALVQQGIHEYLQEHLPALVAQEVRRALRERERDPNAGQPPPGL